MSPRSTVLPGRRIAPTGADAEWSTALTDAEAAVFVPFPMTVLPAFERARPLRIVAGVDTGDRLAGREAPATVSALRPAASRSEASARAWELAVRSGHPSVAGGTAGRQGSATPAVQAADTALQSAMRPALRPGLRLTRRGRVVLVVVLALLITVAAFFVGRVSSFASTGAAGSSASYPTVVVQPGDTLWSIATHLAPHTDPRVTVQRIIELNALRSADVQPGEQLALPS